MPDEVAAARMEVFDALPEEFRRFIAEYPRGLIATNCARVLDMHDGDVEAAKAYIMARLPVPADQLAPMVPRRRRRTFR